MKKLCLLGLCISLSAVADANVESYSTSLDSLDYAQVKNVAATQSQNGSWCFSTQVRHNDQSWEHYADAWQITDLEGKVLGERVLLHPHDNEQPFTRSLCNVEITETIQKVIVKAKCNIHGFGGEKVIVDLSKTKGKGFTLKRAN
tara:strand:+ start:2770 stop:3204 length:435 start_codon:yes stop_codon:yes gene_type:complete